MKREKKVLGGRSEAECESLRDVISTMCVVTKILRVHIVSSHGFTSLLVIVTWHVNKTLTSFIY